MGLLLFLVYFVFSLMILYRTSSPSIWEIASALYLGVATFLVGFPLHMGLPIWVVIISIILVMRVEVVRSTITNFMFKLAIKSIPKLSKT